MQGQPFLLFVLFFLGWVSVSNAIQPSYASIRYQSYVNQKVKWVRVTPLLRVN